MPSRSSCGNVSFSAVWQVGQVSLPAAVQSMRQQKQKEWPQGRTLVAPARYSMQTGHSSISRILSTVCVAATVGLFEVESSAVLQLAEECSIGGTGDKSDAGPAEAGAVSAELSQDSALSVVSQVSEGLIRCIVSDLHSISKLK